MASFKIAIIRLMRFCVRLLYFVPIKQNRIVFCSYLGESYSCNPKYISEYLKKEYPNKYELIWAFHYPNEYKIISGIKPIKYKSLNWLFSCITAKVIITNDGAIWIPRRNGQLIIDTWHGGGCYKKVATEVKNMDKLSSFRNKISVKEVNLYLSSSEYFSKNVIRKSFLYNGKILPCGMPRNDILFENSDVFVRGEIRDEIATKYHFNANNFVVLFAPTWRKKDERAEQLNVEMLSDVIKNRYGKNVTVLVRGHHKEKHIVESQVTNVTDYPDMQELLKAVDMLITDYSSSIWDFSFTGKPCFLFTPDLESYICDPGLDCDIYTWGFPVCKSNAILAEKIKHFDEKEHRENMQRHHINLVSYEDGHACKRICEYIDSFCENN